MASQSKKLQRFTIGSVFLAAMALGTTNTSAASPEKVFEDLDAIQTQVEKAKGCKTKSCQNRKINRVARTYNRICFPPYQSQIKHREAKSHNSKTCRAVRAALLKLGFSDQ